MQEIYTEYEAAVEWCAKRDMTTWGLELRLDFSGFLLAMERAKHNILRAFLPVVKPPRTGGRPQDDVMPLVELIREMQIEAVRNRPTGVVLPSMNAIYREARKRWGHGPNRVKVRRAFKQLGSQY